MTTALHNRGPNGSPGLFCASSGRAPCWPRFTPWRRLAAGGLTARGRYAMACAALLAMALWPLATYWWLARSGSAASPAPALAPLNTQAAAAAFRYTADPWQAALPWIVMAWFAGVAGCSVRLAAGWISAARLRSSHHGPASAEWQHALQRLIERMRVRRSVRLLVSDRVESLSVIGHGTKTPEACAVIETVPGEEAPVGYG